MKSKCVVASALAAGALLTTAARADENLFGYSYGAETLPKGKNEVYLWFTDRRHKSAGSYNAQDYEFEFERGLTDRLQGSLYLTFASHDFENILFSAPAPGDAPEFESLDRKFGFNGVKASVKYAILNPYTDGFGLAIYVEPGYAGIGKEDGERETQIFLETKLLLQKNFLEDRLIWVGNVTFEQEFENADGDEWEAEGEFELSSGLGYRLAPHWYAGVEARYHSIYENFPAELERERYALFVGPNIHYGAKNWWFTVTYLPQVSGGPKGPSSADFNLYQYEKRELRLKVGYDF